MLAPHARIYRPRRTRHARTRITRFASTTLLAAVAMLAMFGCDAPDFGAVHGGMLGGGPSHAPADDETDETDETSETTDDEQPLLDLGSEPSESTDTDTDTGGESGESPTPCTEHAECSEFAGPCSAGVCGLNGCEAVPYVDGLECVTGDKCVIGGSCSAGECLGSLVDCSALDSQCSAGTCDPDTGACLSVALDCEPEPEPEPEPQQQPEPEPEPEPCPIGASGCSCTGGGGCDPGLACYQSVCYPPDLNPAVSFLAHAVGRDFYRVQADGLMSDQTILDTCAAVNLATPCGAQSTDGSLPNAGSFPWHDQHCEQVLGPPSPWGETLIRAISLVMIGPDCEGPGSGCAALAGSWVYTAGMNRRWLKTAVGPWPNSNDDDSFAWVSMGASGLDTYQGVRDYVTGIGGLQHNPFGGLVALPGTGSPNAANYSSRFAICVAP